MKRFFTTRNVILSLVAVILLLVAAGKAGWLGGKEGTKVTAEKASLRSITESVTASGKVQPEKAVKISSDVSGEIVELKVKEGQRIRKGDLLCKIRQDIYVSNLDKMGAMLNTSKANLANTRARLLQAKAQFANAEANFQRQKKLIDQQAISQAEFDGVKASYETARAEVMAAEQSVSAADFSVKNAEASVKEAGDNLQRTTIYSPVDGIVSKLNVEEGERVVGTSQMAGTEILTIADLKEMEVNVDVNENDIVRVKTGDTALIEVDAWIDRKFKGIVTEIANSSNTVGMNADQVTNFPVKVRILRESYTDLLIADKPDYSPFRPGMSASVEVLTRRVSNVLSVPIQSVTTREDTTGFGVDEKHRKEVSDKQKGGTDSSSEVREEQDNETRIARQFVFVVEGSRAILREVKTGIQDDNHIQILSGLKVGEEVVSGPYRAVSKGLKNRTPIEKVEKEDLFGAAPEEQ
jgi:HlyD family secretion protein